MRALLIILPLAISACGSSWQDNAAKSLDVVQKLSAEAYKQARPILHAKCLAVAKKCPKADLKTCEAWVICDEKRTRIMNALALLQKGIAVTADIVPELAEVIE